MGLYMLTAGYKYRALALLRSVFLVEEQYIFAVYMYKH